MTERLTQCPNCNTEWDDLEVLNHECFTCGWPEIKLDIFDKSDEAYQNLKDKENEI